MKKNAQRAVVKRKQIPLHVFAVVAFFFVTALSYWSWRTFLAEGGDTSVRENIDTPGDAPAARSSEQTDSDAAGAPGGGQPQTFLSKEESPKLSIEQLLLEGVCPRTYSPLGLFPAVMKNQLQSLTELFLGFGTRVAGEWEAGNLDTLNTLNPVQKVGMLLGKEGAVDLSSSGWLRSFEFIRTMASCNDEPQSSSTSASSSSSFWSLHEDGFETDIFEHGPHFHTVQGTDKEDTMRTLKKSKTKFRNIVAELTTGDPDIGHLVLSAHFDSKWFADLESSEQFHFVGACDSAVPVVMLLELMKRISTREYHCMSNEKRSVSCETLPAITVMFFDGEEAFYEWRGADNTYGSRHLAQRWSDDPSAPLDRQRISNISLFTLLDLIGPPNTVFHNYFADRTGRSFMKLAEIEQRLAREGRLFTKGPRSRGRRAKEVQGDGSIKKVQYYETFFNTGPRQPSMIEDDHVPWLRRNVPILHLISLPFPKTWHKAGDDARNVDYNSVYDLLEIFEEFVLTYTRRSDVG